VYTPIDREAKTEIPVKIERYAGSPEAETSGKTQAKPKSMAKAKV